MSRDGEKREGFCLIDSNWGEPSIGNSATRIYWRPAAADGLVGDLNVGSLVVVEPQDHGHADDSYIPPLSDEIALLIIARVPQSEQAKLALVNKRYLGLVRSGELYKIRQEIGVPEPLVFVFSGGDHWWAIDPRTGCCRMLPVLPADLCFMFGDKETLCVGTQLLVTGRMVTGMVTWRYDLAMNRWLMGPSMITPRCLFASANCGNFACVAGGVVVESKIKVPESGPASKSKVEVTVEVLNSAEKYNPDSKSWDPLPRMNRRRKLCSGCYMDKKFYVIGGMDENDRSLNCGEFYDVEKNTWVLVQDMLGAPSPSSGSPPLIAVANNELYLLDSLMNQLKVYLKGSNSWKVLGDAPVQADTNRGWGVAFKSLGDELLVIGALRSSQAGCRMMAIFTCQPDPGGNGLCWQHVETNGNSMRSFIYNCAVMVA